MTYTILDVSVSRSLEKIRGIVNNLFRPQKTLRNTRMESFNIPAHLPLLYGSENLTIKARDTRKVTAAGKKYI
jgi:hypothetical protein